MPGLRRYSRSPFDDIMHVEDDGTEWWSARELMEPLYLNYVDWRNMLNVVRKARSACRNSGFDPADHFVDVNEMVDLGSGARRERQDVQMTRYGCYLVAMNGDPDKREVAAAQTYFTLMTRAAEKAVVVPAAVAHTPRPWSERFCQTIEPHLQYINIHHPGCFTVVTTLVGQMLSMEDELIRHLFELKISDRPDVSIGRRWSEDRKSRGMPPADRFAPLKLPDQSVTPELRVYPDTERGTFEVWFNKVYLPHNLPTYYGDKPDFKVHGELPSASAADNTCQRLTGTPAVLKTPLRKQLTAVGGFFPVGKQLPKSVNPQRTLFSLEGDG